MLPTLRVVPLSKFGPRPAHRWFEEVEEQLASPLFKSLLNPIANNVAFPWTTETQDQAYVIKAELPGVRPEELNLSIEEGRLTLEVIQNEQAQHRFARQKRSVLLPKDVVIDDIKAKQEHGVLTITLPRQNKTVVTKVIKIES